MIPYGHQSIDDDDILAVTEVLRSDWLTQGPKVEEFENVLSAYCGTKYAVVFSSGTAALQAAYVALGLKSGDEFITTPLTFAATANAGLWQGGVPVFADIDPMTGNIDPAKIEAQITSKTKIIVPVDFAGVPADLSVIQALATRHHLLVLEDACHALGATLEGKKIGSFSDCTVFSFHPVKVITTGEGGAVTTNNETYYRRLKVFRTHGITKENLTRPSPGEWYQEMQELGSNYRLTDFQCALGISQMKKVGRFLALRRQIAERYTKAFLNSRVVQVPVEPRGTESGWHLYPIRLKNEWAKRRDEVFQALRAQGIGVQVHYLPVYEHPYYQKLGYKKGLCLNAESFSASEISLPIFPDFSLSDQTRVIETVQGIVGI